MIFLNKKQKKLLSTLQKLINVIYLCIGHVMYIINSFLEVV
jgi:hypothetical protein